MLSRTPFVTIAIFLMAGILLARPAGAAHFSWIFMAAACASALSAAILFYRIRRMQLFGIAFAAGVLVSGICSMGLHDKMLETQRKSIRTQFYTAYRAVLTSLPEKRPHSLRAEGFVNALQVSGKWVPTAAKVLFSFPENSTGVPAPGTSFIAHGKLAEPQKPGNPAQFDYQKYLGNRGILFTARLRDTDFQCIRDSSAPIPLNLAASAWADAVFVNHIKDHASYGLVKAMLLGRRDDLGEELVQDYTVSGAVHILSVSGMHVAIIFLVISYLLGWVKKLPLGRAVFLCIVTILLVFYAIVTGLPPSVQRATFMCLVFAAADAFERKNEPMNTLGISAVLVLLWQPAAIFDVGFQLSYLAMAGIFLFYASIERIFVFEKRIPTFFWQVTALSLAAQLTTFPLSLYYFHQFPTYFWLANPFVIFFTNILLPAALIMLITSLISFAPLQWIVNTVVHWSAKLANWSVSIPGQIPGNLVESIHLTLYETLLLYGLMLLVWLAMHFREIRYFKLAVAGSFIFCVSAIMGSSVQMFQSKWVVHMVSGHGVVSLKKGNRLYIASDDAFRTDTRAFNFTIKNYAVTEEVDRTIFVQSNHWTE